jgi:hypothetical protein
VCQEQLSPTITNYHQLSPTISNHIVCVYAWSRYLCPPPTRSMPWCCDVRKIPGARRCMSLNTTTACNDRGYLVDRVCLPGKWVS